MSSCVLTIIKNEHPYLNEWISYHLDMGVHHIFIFEDIDSKSHAEIVKKYEKSVTLSSISSILTEQEVLLTRRLKLTKRENPQHTYYKKALSYVQSLGQYDWAFPVDADEFITLQDSTNTIDSVMSRYDDYDAVLLQWECYGANRLITRPPYDKRGVLDTFTLPAPPHTLPSPRPDSWSKRVVFNLRTFQPQFYHLVHQPSDSCNFVNTAFQPDRKTWCYDKIYLRHYITKSWQEYLWKKFERGYFMGFSRTLEAFFPLNPELAGVKDDLLFAVNHPVLVVLPYLQARSQGNELRNALWGWRRNCRFRYHFVVIGEFDPAFVSEFPWVEFIECPAATKIAGQYNPHLDMQHKMEVCYDRFKDQYPGFIWMVDDNYAIKPFTSFEIFQTHYKSLNFTGKQDTPTWFWKHDKWKTRQLLDTEGLPHVNYTTHFPCYFNFERLKKIWDRYDMRTNSYVVEDLYFNTYHDSRPLPAEEIRYGVWGPARMDGRLDAAIADPAIKFLVNSVEGWSPEFEAALQRLIDEPAS